MKNYGISRIDQPKKKNHGWYVRITYAGKSHSKFFSDKLLGGKKKSFEQAREHRDKLFSRLPKSKQQAMMGWRKPGEIKQSGVVGVTHVLHREGEAAYHYWQASWKDRNGNPRSAKFSFNRYGQEKALELAIRARRNRKRPKV